MIYHQRSYQFLVRLAESSNIPHALLFSGSNEDTLRKVVLEFVGLLLCKNSKKPCNFCQNCLAISAGTYPDLKFVSSTKEAIKIEPIRALKDFLSLKSTLGYKVAVIENAHLMTAEAQSSLLKLLEEPKGRAVLILTTSFPSLLLPTIRSRVVHLRFPEKNYGLDQKEIQELRKLINSSLAEKFELAKKLGKNKEEAQKVLKTWLKFFRLLLLTNNLPKGYSLKKVIHLAQKTQDTYLLLIKSQVNPQLALENILIEM